MCANDNGHAAKLLDSGPLSRYILKPLADWWAREAAFDELMSLDDRMLKDIGVARCKIQGLAAVKIERQEAANEQRSPQSGTTSEKKLHSRRG
jgi:uncharacterized protein YjiS (DUF1127 family)